MVQLEQEVNGSDYSLNFKTMNANPLEMTGLYMASYLQSVTQNLVVGSEIVLQRPTRDMEETAMSLVGKYTGKDFIATAQFQGMGAIQASYYQRINEKVDFGVELNLMAQGGRREAVATVGGKFDFRAATFRGQIDTTGRVSAVLEEKMAPGFSFLISGDLDHMKVCCYRLIFSLYTHNRNRVKVNSVLVSCCLHRLIYYILLCTKIKKKLIYNNVHDILCKWNGLFKIMKGGICTHNYLFLTKAYCFFNCHR